jgi:hypothetical protein
MPTIKIRKQANGIARYTAEIVRAANPVPSRSGAS